MGKKVFNVQQTEYAREDKENGNASARILHYVLIVSLWISLGVIFYQRIGNDYLPNKRSLETGIFDLLVVLLTIPFYLVLFYTSTALKEMKVLDKLFGIITLICYMIVITR